MALHTAQLGRKVKNYFTIAVAAVQLLSFSVALTPRAIAVAAASCPTATGTTAPTGASAHTFGFNEATCLWENAYYTWNPVSKQYVAKYSKDPVYKADTDTWEHTEWEYNPTVNQYQANIVSVPANTSAPSATSTSSPMPTTTSQTADGSPQSQTTGSATISNTGTDSNNAIANNNNTDVNVGLTNNALITNTLDSNALSGDANIIGNTTGGSATTGDAAAIANILNMIQSSWNPLHGEIATFNASLQNDYFGDLLFDPARIIGTGTSSNNTITDNSNTDIVVNVDENGRIINNLNLNATTGDANVVGNTTAGDATTGDATTIANVINMINSAITSGQSFLGNINLYGDLNGDILLPQSLLAQLLNTGTNSTNTITDAKDTNVDIDTSTNASITNNTDLTATTGGANVDGNTYGGNATTGDAQTSVKQMNLVGQNTVGTKGILVFVNVLGTWLGMILDSPTNASIVGTGTGSNNAIADSSITNVDATINRNYEIVNNLNLDSTSGNATVSGNTRGGNATSGDASSSVNLLNMIDSRFNFRDWFGVLFINVFGDWFGSFGKDTVAGEKTTGGMGGGTGGATGSTGGSTQFATTTASSHASGSSTTRYGRNNRYRGASTGTSSTQTEVAAVASDATKPARLPDTSSQQSVRRNNLLLPALGGLAAILILGGERLLGLIRARRSE